MGSSVLMSKYLNKNNNYQKIYEIEKKVLICYYCMARKSCSVLYSVLLYKIGQDLLGRQFILRCSGGVDPDPKKTLIRMSRKPGSETKPRNKIGSDFTWRREGRAADTRSSGFCV